MRGGRTRRGVRLQSGDDSGLGNLVRAAVVHVDGGEEEHVALLRHPRRDRLHDLAVDGLLVVGNEILVQELLDLVGREPSKTVSCCSCGVRCVWSTHIQQMS